MRIADVTGQLIRPSYYYSFEIYAEPRESFDVKRTLVTDGGILLGKYKRADDPDKIWALVLAYDGTLGWSRPFELAAANDEGGLP